MKCDEQLLDAYVEDFLSILERQQVEEHLKRCTKCQMILKELQQQQQQLSQLLTPTMPRSLADDIMQHIQPRKKRSKNWRIYITTAAAAILGIGLYIGVKEDLSRQITAPSSEQLPITSEQQNEGSIIFDEYNLTTGKVTIYTHIENLKIKAAEQPLPKVEAFVANDNSAEKPLNITEVTTIQSVKEKDGFVTTIEFDTTKYNEVTFTFSYGVLTDSIIINVANSDVATVYGDYVVKKQGKRLRNEMYEVPFRLTPNDVLLAQYAALDERLQNLSPHHVPGPSYYFLGELRNADGTLLFNEQYSHQVGETFVSQYVESTDTYGEVTVMYAIPEQAGKFPLTLSVSKVLASIPVYKQLNDVKKGDTFTLQGELFKVVKASIEEETIQVVIETTRIHSVIPQAVYVKTSTGSEFMYESYINDGTKPIAEITFTSQPIEKMPEQIDLVIGYAQSTESIDPIEIVFQ